MSTGKSGSHGVSFDEINQTISVAAGSNYVNDYTNNGRVQQVIVRADAPYRMQPEQLLALSVKTVWGRCFHYPLCDAFVECCTAATDTLSGYPAIRITGSSAQENRQVPQWRQWTIWLSTYHRGSPGVGGKFVTGKESASQLPGLIVLSVLVVFMVLAALYESWSIPFAVMLVVPLGLLGAVLAVSVTNMTNDVFSKWV